MPIAFAGVVVSALFDRRVRLLTVVLLTVLIASQPAYRTPAALPVLLASGTSRGSRRTLRREAAISPISGSSSWPLSTSVAASARTWRWRHRRPDLLIGAIRAAATSVVGVIAAMLFMPFAERITGVETHLTLLEWGDLHHPLLQRLSLEAPGTYAHTVAIANMAEAACRAIGANALLARVGAYYHDIGKLAKPQYFVENQPRGRNPHDKLKPSTSASIIRNHVRKGSSSRSRREAAGSGRAPSSPSTTARARSPTSWSVPGSATAPCLTRPISPILGRSRRAPRRRS